MPHAIVYNGASGGLGRYLGPALAKAKVPSHAIAARLEDAEGLRRELDHVEPHGEMTFIHLAGLVPVAICEAEPERAHRVNVVLARQAAQVVAAWAQERGVSLRLLYVSSGHVYAPATVGSRISEAAPTGPRSVYARTKLEAEQQLAALCDQASIPFLAARVFGLVGPAQPAQYVLPGLIDRVRRGALNGIPGLDYARDYLDARDVSDALRALSESAWAEAADVVNVCSGLPVTIGELLSLVIESMAAAGVSTPSDEATGAPGRAGDVEWLVGDPSRFCAVAGHHPQTISLRQTVRDAVAAALSS